MSIPEDIVHVVYAFNTGDPQEEIAQFGHYLRYEHDVITEPTPAWDVMTQHLADDLAPKFNTFWAAIRGKFTSEISPVNIKCTHLSTTRHALDVATASLTSDNGSSGGSSLPYEVSMAVTLYGYDPGHFVPNSRRRRNRFYLPPLSSSVMGDQGRFASAAVSDIAVAVDDWLEDVQGVRTRAGDSTGTSAGYFRLVTVSAVGAGRWDQVFASSIGDVPDAQRRRRNHQREVRTYSALSSS